MIGEFYIYQAPPVKVLDKEMHKTLDSLDSVPCGYFYIGLKSEWYIKNEYFQKVQMWLAKIYLWQKLQYLTMLKEAIKILFEANNTRKTITR